MDLASAEAEIRHVFGDTLIAEASIGAAPPDILVKHSGLVTRVCNNWQILFIGRIPKPVFVQFCCPPLGH